tara:strand:+ start:1169 stop:2017 length:849 start_codon:yes stop_codon:yes gene_type:complete
MNALNNYKEKGYHIEKSVIPISAHKELFFTYYDLAISLIQRNKKISLNFEIKNIEDLIYPNDIKHLDNLLLAILKFDPKLIGEIYDTMSYCSNFLRVVSNTKIEEISREILELKNYNTIYSYMNRILIQAPNDKRRTYGWHQEIFYTIPNTKFVQAYCPIIRDVTIENGALEICKNSHKDGLVKQSWNEPDNRVLQIIADQKKVDKYEKVKLPMQLGDFLFFNPYLIHRSGDNSTKDEIRFSLVTIWNDCSYSGWRPPFPDFKTRTLTAKENFNKLKPNEID